MTEAEVRNVLPTDLIIPDGDGDRILLRQDEQGIMSIPLANFVSRFSPAKMTFAGLSAHPNADDVWAQVFTDWKKKGYIA